MTVPIKDLSRYELRQLANINLQSIAQLCVLLSEQDTNIYLDYIISGAQSFKEGFNAKEDDNGDKA